MRNKGIIINWNEKKRFGFIKPDKGGNNVFAHITDFTDRLEGSLDGKKVSYEVSQDSRGRVCAVNVQFKSSIYRTKPKTTYFLLLSLFTAIILWLTYGAGYPVEVLALYLFMSTISFLAYAADKEAAKRRRWRVSEGQLHLLDILGGWPGAIMAQQLLRHKTAKARYRIAFWITVLINCMLLAITFTEPGRIYLDTAVQHIKNFFGY